MPPKSKLAKKNQVKKDKDIPLPVDKVSDQDDLITSVSKQQEEEDDDDEITPVNNNKKAIEEEEDLITSVSDEKKAVEEDDDDLIISVNEMKNQDDDLVSNGTDVNDPIQQDNSVPVTEPMTTKETSIINSAKSEFANLTSKINPFTQKLGKGLYQVRQYATEKLGTAESVTQLPQEYKDLEKRVDALCHVHANLLKVTKTYGVHSYDYPESILSVTNQILSSSNDHRAPKTLSHALSRAASSSALIDGESVYGTALSKYAVASDKLGNARLVMDHEIVTHFNERMQQTQHTSMQGVTKARREVAAKRFSLDAARSKYHGVGLEVEAAEDEFVGAVEQSTHLMKALLQDPEPLRDLSAMAQAQLGYFKEAEEIFSGMLPELEALLKTQEMTYRQSSSDGHNEQE